MRWPGRPLKAQVMLDFIFFFTGCGTFEKMQIVLAVLTDASLEAILVNGQMKRGPSKMMAGKKPPATDC